MRLYVQGVFMMEIIYQSLNEASKIISGLRVNQGKHGRISGRSNGECRSELIVIVQKAFHYHGFCPIR